MISRLIAHVRSLIIYHAWLRGLYSTGRAYRAHHRY